MTANKLLKKNRKIADTGIFLALFLGLAYIFTYIPNVEFITAIAFLSGFLLGWKRGLFVAVTGEAIYSIANPFGSGLAYPVMLGAQLISFALFAIIGFIFRYFMLELIERKPGLSSFILGITGLFLSVIYSFFTSVAFAVSSGFDISQTLAGFIAGLPFYIVHFIANTLIFSLLVPYVISYTKKHYPIYFEAT